jgi:hydrogenase maturation protein HypF
MINSATSKIRLRVRANGAVQGVGFRPYVFQIARSCKVTGSIANIGGGVQIEVEGKVEEVRQFVSNLREKLPPHACIRSLQVEELPTVGDETSFAIAKSVSNGGATSILPDLRICDECLVELFDPDNRRHRYGLITCTHCGPRFSIIDRVPFDRANTTLSHFPLGSICQVEYDNPLDRRFHAQSIACEICGPRVVLCDASRQELGGDPIEVARQMLLEGKTLAIKGIGGFHLAARADDQGAVARIRQGKHRDDKPFAVMVGSLEEAKKLACFSDCGELLLKSSIAPIVIAPMREGHGLCDAIAPGLNRLGVMLPYTPIQHLLFAGGLVPLVMTSANNNGEPIIHEDDRAFGELQYRVDGFLTHNRPIARGIDDSVLIDLEDLPPAIIRRARGYVPAEVSLPVASPAPGLAMGADLKSAFVMVREGDAILSQHLGDLGDAGAFERFAEAIEDFQSLFCVDPRFIVRDAHPKYFSSQHALALAERSKIPLITVQHHHAHAASVLAEHGIKEKTLSLICDGTGYGSDGTIWGGELLLADLTSCKRLARLKPLRLAGGDAAAKDAARCGMALLYNAYGETFNQSPQRKNLIDSDSDRELIELMVRANVSCAQSSGAGRYFDGVAALLGICRWNTFEGRAAMMLQAAAERGGAARLITDLFGVSETNGLLELDFAPFVREVCADGNRFTPEEWAAVFHDQFVRGWIAVIARCAPQTRSGRIALSGGVFCNARLVKDFTTQLAPQSLIALRNELVPPNDGGIALGQAAIASAVISECGLSAKEIPCV